MGKKEGKNVIPTMEQLFCLATYYRCEIGYLLCEYDLPTKTETDIHEQTGLSEEAINLLIEANREHSKKLGLLQHSDVRDKWLAKQREDFINGISEFPDMNDPEKKKKR